MWVHDPLELLRLLLEAEERGGVTGVAEEEESRCSGHHEHDRHDPAEVVGDPSGEVEALGSGECGSAPVRLRGFGK